jgi:hypothetical protein
MNLFELYKFCEYLGSKEISGYSLSPDEFNSNLPIVEERYLKFLINEIDSIKDVSHSLEKFRTELPIVNNIVTGKSNKPTDLIYLENASYPYDGKTVNIDIVGSVEYKDRVTSVLVNPTAKNPIILMASGTLNIEPKNIVGYNIMYIRKPTTPYMDYVIDENFNIGYKNIGTNLSGNGSELVNVVLNNVGNYFWTIHYDYALAKIVFSIYEDVNFTNKLGYANINPTITSSGTIISNTLTGTVTMLQTVTTIDYTSNSKINSIVINKNINNLTDIYYRAYYALNGNYAFDIFSNSSLSNLLVHGEFNSRVVTFNQNGISGVVTYENSWIPKRIDWDTNEPTNNEVSIRAYNSTTSGTWNLIVKDNPVTGRTDMYLYKYGSFVGQGVATSFNKKNIKFTGNPSVSVDIELNYTLLLSKSLSARVINSYSTYTTGFKNVYGDNSNDGILYIRTTYTNSGSNYYITVSVYKDALYTELVCSYTSINLNDDVNSLITALNNNIPIPETATYLNVNLLDTITGLEGLFIVRMFDYVGKTKYAQGNVDSTMTYDVQYFTAKNERTFVANLTFDIEANQDDNRISLFGIYKDEGNTLIKYDDNITVESEFTEIDDQIKIAGILLNMQGINIKDQTILEYSKQFKPLP